MKHQCIFLVLFIFNSVFANETPVYLDVNAPIEERIEDALSRMTIEEKVAMCHAQSKFSSAGVPRLGIPENWMTDGPHGIRPEVFWNEWNQAGWTNDSCVAFPALTCLAATWNPEMAYLYGKSIGEEARYRNKNVLLGPGVNIYRTPLNGRNFEYMGEDPFLASKMVVPYVRGVQSNGVAACIKHFALNNQETNRHTVNVHVSDRALYEIYLPAFKAAVQEGGAWAIMGAYNLYKNQHACHNQYLLNDILRREWNYDGVVISDWGGVYDTYESAYHGLDMEFGTGTDGLKDVQTNEYDAYHMAKPYLTLIENGDIPIENLDNKVRNILRLVFRTTMSANRPFGSFCSPEHFNAARKIANEGIVLLKNDNNVLPIKLENKKKIAVIGENAIRMMTVGGGSSSLKAKYEISPLDGIKAAVGNMADVIFARGYVGDISTEYNGVNTGQAIEENREKNILITEACKIAEISDVVIFIGGLNKEAHQDCEDTDRYGLELPYGQNELLTALSKVNDNIVVVLISGNAVAMPWVNDVESIIQAWYGGSEAGNAIADILFGKVNPSGKLPFSFAKRLNDYGAHALNTYPGDKDVYYKEDIFVGYRWLEKNEIEPLFPFGHGLSYTTFEYGKPEFSSTVLNQNDSIRISVPIKNTGNQQGKEVVQLYIGDKKSTFQRPLKELKAFKKIELQPGEEKNVDFKISVADLSFFDDIKHTWTYETGKFTVYIGASSADIKYKTEITLK